MNKLVIGGTIILVCLAIGFKVMSSSEYVSQMKYVSEALAEKEYYSKHEIQVYGEIVQGSFERIAPRSYKFMLTDGNATLEVNYVGELPGSFNENARVVVVGKFQGNIFKAYKLLTKCPSKYEAKEN